MACSGLPSADSGPPLLRRDAPRSFGRQWLLAPSRETGLQPGTTGGLLPRTKFHDPLLCVHRPAGRQMGLQVERLALLQPLRRNAEGARVDPEAYVLWLFYRRRRARIRPLS